MSANRALKLFRQSPSRHVVSTYADLKKIIFFRAHAGCFDCTVYCHKKNLTSFLLRLRKEGFYAVAGPNTFIKRKKMIPSVKVSWDPNLTS